MGKIEVYKKQYKNSEVKRYYDLIRNIKDNSFDDSNEIKRYLTFEGDFLIKISPELSKNYENTTNNVKIAIEKIGPECEKESKIERVLIQEGFKRITNEEKY
jgi:hypothetical protein